MNFIATSDDVYWMAKTIVLIANMFELMITNPNMPLSDCIYQSYKVVLAKHHMWLTKKIAKLATKFAGSKDTFFKNTGIKDPEALNTVSINF